MGLGGVQSDHCLPCLRGFHTTCMPPCTCDHKLGETSATIVSMPTDTKRVVRTRKAKRDDALKDQQSTGRKRAAIAYPFLDKDGNKLKRGADIALFRDCEWAGKSNCGGGTTITGCGLEGRPVGKGINRHHGPDKNTLNNEEGNVHRICPTCHNRWHSANDADYDPNKPLKD